MRIDLILHCLLLLVFAWTLTAGAVDFFAAADSGQPLEITSNQLEVFQQEQKSVFSGDVVAQQGEMTLYTDQLTVIFDGQNDVSRVEAIGRVRIEEPLRHARGNQAVFDRAADTLILSGNAEVVQGENRIAGDEITLFIGQNRSLVRSTDSGRVRAVILPEKKPESP
ncbi:lipopolysaccharide transport periplasmic protein LptA [Pelovirga terrestris]|uniref:Lipopolysaccharide transport periplasmic protein LptA n=1 Tax=Pelovirga terrestris TaxID=2771352 RepID=A0A8J6UIS9_9BACT|nr:lipopolysaccharide transport periplasmic protein LptA [Pelovirga terrestris]